jgi:hypothetical protein
MTCRGFFETNRGGFAGLMAGRLVPLGARDGEESSTCPRRLDPALLDLAGVLAR